MSGLEAMLKDVKDGDIVYLRETKMKGPASKGVRPPGKGKTTRAGEKNIKKDLPRRVKWGRKRRPDLERRPPKRRGDHGQGY